MTERPHFAKLAIAATCLFLAGAASAGDSLTDEAKGTEQMKSLLKMKPEMVMGSPVEMDAKANALDAFLLWMEKEYPIVKDDIPAPILSGVELWTAPAMIEFMSKQHGRMEQLYAIGEMQDTSSLTIPLERIRKLRSEDVAQIITCLGGFATTLMKGGEEERSLIPVVTLLRLSRILGASEAVSPECEKMSLGIKGAALGLIQAILDKSNQPFRKETLLIIAQMTETPPWPQPLENTLRRYWSYHTYRLVLPTCRGKWLDLAVPEYTMNHPKAGTTALTSCAAAWLNQTSKLGLSAYKTPVSAPPWEAPEGLPEEDRLWAAEQYQFMADEGTAAATVQAWTHLIRAAVLDALDSPDPEENEVKITFKDVDGHRVASLPDDVPATFQSVRVPAVAK